MDEPALIAALRSGGIAAAGLDVYDNEPGPVHIELPLDVITAPADDLSRDAHRPGSRPGSDPNAIARAAALLRDAPRPPSSCSAAAPRAQPMPPGRSSSGWGAPAALTINAKGVLPPGHPLQPRQHPAAQPPVLDALQAADVVLAVGMELGETDTLLFGRSLALTGKVIRIDIEAEQMVRNALPDVAICSDAGLAMRALLYVLPAREPAAALARVEALRRELAGLLRPDYRLHGRFLDVPRRCPPRRRHRPRFPPSPSMAAT